MLEDIRKYTGLFIVVLVLIFVGLVFWEGGAQSGPGGGPTLVRSDLGSLSLKDLQNDGEKIVRLANRLQQTAFQNGAQNGGLDLYSYTNTLNRKQFVEPDAPYEEIMGSFLINRRNLQQAMKDYGLYASKEEIDVYQRENLFTGRDGLFDQQGYSQFIDSGLKGLSLTVNDLNTFIGEILAFKKLGELVGAGVQTNEDSAKEVFTSNAQTITLSSFSLNLEPLKKEITPTEDEIKAYWEENRGKYLSAPKRAVTYVHKLPNFILALEEKKASAAAQAAEAEAEANEEEKEEITLTQEERNKVISDIGSTFDDLWVEIQQSIENGAQKADLETIAPEYDLQVLTTELLELEKMPMALRGPVRDSRGQTMQNVLANTQVTNPEDPLKALSDPLPTGPDGWIIFRVDEAEEPAELTFEDAKEDATKDLITQLAQESLETKINEARETLATTNKNGESLEEKAAELGLQTRQHTKMTTTATLPGEANPRDVFRLGARTNPGEISEAEVLSNNRGLFVFVSEREFVDNDQNKRGLENSLTRAKTELRNALLDHWFVAKFQQANVDFVQPNS
ncbi:MAG: SurA N-terminal domain-containing protein [Verrucomicrobiota bacterium]